MNTYRISRKYIDYDELRCQWGVAIISSLALDLISETDILCPGVISLEGDGFNYFYERKQVIWQNVRTKVQKAL